MRPKIYELVARYRYPFPWEVVSEDVGPSYCRDVIEEAARRMQLENPDWQYAIATIGDLGRLAIEIDQCDRTCQNCGSTLIQGLPSLPLSVAGSTLISGGTGSEGCPECSVPPE